MNNFPLDGSALFKLIFNCSTSRAACSFSNFSLSLLSFLVSFFSFLSSSNIFSSVSFLSFTPSTASDILFAKSIPNIDTTNATSPPIASTPVPVLSINFIKGIVIIVDAAPPPDPVFAPKS